MESIELNDLTSKKDFNSYKDFQEFINEHKDEIIVAKFYRSNCPYCIEYTPVFEELKQLYKDNFHFTNINIERDMLFKYKYKISDLPTTLIIKEGIPYYRRIGVLPFLEIKERLDRIQTISQKDNLIETQARVK